jgi:hypothetical protein
MSRPNRPPRLIKLYIVPIKLQSTGATAAVSNEIAYLPQRSLRMSILRSPHTMYVYKEREVEARNSISTVRTLEHYSGLSQLVAQSLSPHLPRSNGSTATPQGEASAEPPIQSELHHGMHPRLYPRYLLGSDRSWSWRRPTFVTTRRLSYKLVGLPHAIFSRRWLIMLLESSMDFSHFLDGVPARYSISWGQRSRSVLVRSATRKIRNCS